MLKKFLFKYLPVFSAILILISCENTPNSTIEIPKSIQKPVIGKEKLVKLLVDIHLADGYISNNQKDFLEQVKKTGIVKKNEALTNFYASVFKKNKVSNKDFYKTLEYYSFHQKELLEIYEEVLDKLNMKLDSVKVSK